MVASYVKDNLDRVFLGPAATRQGVTESVTETWERVNIIYSDVREVYDKVGIKNSQKNALVERLFTPIFLRDFRINNLEFLHVKKICGKIPDGGISILAGKILEMIIGFVRNFNSSKVPHVRFTGKYGTTPCKSELVWTRKPQISFG